MAIFEFVFFCVCSLLCFLGGVATVAAKNPIRGAMGLLAAIIGIAGMYLLLSAEMLAAIQVIVYAGAVVILFLFVIMLLGPVAAQEPDARGAISRYVGAALMLGASIAALLAIVGSGGGQPTAFAPVAGGMGSVEAIGHAMFGRGIVAFQITGLLLLVGVVGAMAVAKGRHGDVAATAAKMAQLKSRGPRAPSLVAPLAPNRPTTGAHTPRPVEELRAAGEAEGGLAHGREPVAPRGVVIKEHA
jgi:NADH-quinone oxidoreductase subunit J